MDPKMIAVVLWKRALLRRHERWSRQRLALYRIKKLHELRRHAVKNSPFYARLHRGLEERPLEELPVVTKQTMMEHFDDFVTDRNIRIRDIETYIAGRKGDEKFLNRYRVSLTAGSTGRRGFFLTDFNEWTTVLASYSRANDWSGLRVDLAHPMKMAIVSTTTPWHQSAMVGASVASRWVPTLRLDATDEVSEIVNKLNQFQPDSLVGYASMVRMLAMEQIGGPLRIRPRAVMCASEVMAEETRLMAGEAWRIEPFNVYGATETAGIGCECDLHKGMHIFEDLVIVEIVDEANRPVPPGVTGDKILVTVLFSRTQPLIRYEISDRVAVSDRLCDCGRPFRLIESVEGRMEDIMTLPGSGGSVRIHPNLFHNVLERVALGGWQVRQERDLLRILLVGAPVSLDPDRIIQGLSYSLLSAGAVVPPIVVEVVEQIPKTGAGKSRLIVPFEEAREGGG